MTKREGRYYSRREGKHAQPHNSRVPVLPEIHAGVRKAAWPPGLRIRTRQKKPRTALARRLALTLIMSTASFDEAGRVPLEHIPALLRTEMIGLSLVIKAACGSVPVNLGTADHIFCLIHEASLLSSDLIPHKNSNARLGLLEGRVKRITRHLRRVFPIAPPFLLLSAPFMDP